jgi:hypothetical protein
LNSNLPVLIGKPLFIQNSFGAGCSHHETKAIVARKLEAGAFLQNCRHSFITGNRWDGHTLIASLRCFVEEYRRVTYLHLLRPCWFCYSFADCLLCLQVLEVKLSREPVRLLQLRNPHGRGQWQGDFSSTDLKERWPDVKFLIQMQYGDKLKMEDNGTFYMSFDDFVK